MNKGQEASESLVCLTSWVIQFVLSFMLAFPFFFQKSQALQHGSSALLAVPALGLGALLSLGLSAVIPQAHLIARPPESSVGWACLSLSLHGIFFPVNVWGVSVYWGSGCLLPTPLRKFFLLVVTGSVLPWWPFLGHTLLKICRCKAGPQI